MADVNVKGLAELQKFLDQLTPKLERNVMRGALRSGMSVVKPVAQSNISSVSGELARGLRVSTRSRGGRVSASLKTSGTHDYIARFVEFGTRPHLIKVQESEKPTNKRASRKAGREIKVSMRTINRGVLVIGNQFVGPTISHPGARPHPFMRPALDSQATSAVIAAGEYVKRRLATKHGLDASHIRIEGDE